MSSRFSYKKTKSSFYETQKLRYLVPYIAVVLLLLMLTAFAIEKFVTGKSMIVIDFKVWHYVVMIMLVPVPLLVLLIRTRLDTVVDEDGVMYRWTPYDKRFHLLHWSAITEIVLLDMKPIGLLWRLKMKHHKRFFLGGRYCMEVRMRNGNKVLLGTHKPDELQRSLTQNAGTKFNQEESTIVFDYS
jgi:hypothetical protein